MLIQNNVAGQRNHGKIILDELNQADEAKLLVSYVRDSGVNVILKSLKGTKTKLICTFDLKITALSAVEKLMANNVEVRTQTGSGHGTFHPKLWLFKRSNKWRALIGSANLTQPAFMSNVEASVLLDDTSITDDAISLFNYLWDNTDPLDVTTIQELQADFDKRQKIKAPDFKRSIQSNPQKIKALLSFIKNWIDISKGSQYGISSLWRGWYIIPDQGYVTDKLIGNLMEYVKLVGDQIELDGNNPSLGYDKLLNEFVRRSSFKRQNLRLNRHQLFIRQSKNYLIHFGWAKHPIEKRTKKYVQNKSVLLRTEFGERVANCGKVAEAKLIYSEYFEDYEFNGLRIVEFTRKLLQRFEYLDLDEFNYFVTHAYTEADFDAIAKLISIYRACTSKKTLKKQAREYFEKVKGSTAQNVYGNYVKSVKHTMSVIGWCSDFSVDLDKFVIRLATDAE